MRDEYALNKISEMISEIFKSDFHSIEIVDVKVHSDVDFDGDDILRIEVIFDGLPKNMDTSILSSAVRHIRPKLAEMNEMAFPLLSFISSNEIRSNGGGLAPA